MKVVVKLVNEITVEEEDGKEDQKSNMDLDDNKEITITTTVINDRAFRNSSPIPQNVQDQQLPPIQPQYNVQSKQSKSKNKNKNKNKNKKNTEWKVVLEEIPLPTIAFVDSINNYSDSIYTVSNYIDTFSNRPYAYDHASGTKYNRNESNFDMVDAVTNLAQKSKIKEDDYIKFTFYSNTRI